MDEATKARLTQLITEYEAARDAALAQANMHQGAAQALRQLLAAFTEDPNPPTPPEDQ